MGGREEFTLLSLGVRQHKCCAPRCLSSGGSHCPVGCAPLSRRLRALSRRLRAVVPSVSRREIDCEIASEIDSEIDWEIDSEIDCEIDGEIDFESISYSR